MLVPSNPTERNLMDYTVVEHSESRIIGPIIRTANVALASS